jgi:hypothetical protein
MSLSFCPFFYVLVSYMYVLSQLYPQSYLICICSLLSTFMSKIGVCSDGLVVRVEDSLPRGQWFEFPQLRGKHRVHVWAVVVWNKEVKGESTSLTAILTRLT